MAFTVIKTNSIIAEGLVDEDVNAFLHVKINEALDSILIKIIFSNRQPQGK